MKKLTELQKLKLEQVTYPLADKYIPGYNGGRWSFNEDLQVWVPPADSTGLVHLRNADNYSDIVVPQEWAAMCLGAIAYNKLCWADHERNPALAGLWQENQFHLSDVADSLFGEDGENAGKYFQFID